MRAIATWSRAIIRIALKLCAAALLGVMVAPLLYFAWRATEPMEMPQFGGRTYIEWMNQRRRAYDELARAHQAGHPNQEVKNGICFVTEVGMQIAAGLPSSGFYTLAGIYPSLRSKVDPRDLRDGVVPQAVTWSGFLPAWWGTFEKFVWETAEHAPHGPVPYCRMPESQDFSM